MEVSQATRSQATAIQEVGRMALVCSVAYCEFGSGMKERPASEAPRVLRSESMADQNANTDPKINRCVEELKSKIPAADHGALESRLQGLINDPDADDDDVISILRNEFDPEHG
jgi:hypothetical protein